MQLHELKPAPGSTTSRTRRGRGNGSKGTFSGRGCKGQRARSGGVKNAYHEGGQTSLLLRMPKLKGFKNPNKVDFQVINLSDLENNFESGTTVDPVTLYEAGCAKRSLPIKLLGQGKLTKKLTVICEAASKSAVEAVKKAGGKVELTISSAPAEDQAQTE